MRVGLVGYGKTGKAVAGTLLASDETKLCWILRRSLIPESLRSPDAYGDMAVDEHLFHSIAERSIDELLNIHPVDVIIDFSSAAGIEYYGEAATKRRITIISAVSHYPDETLAKLKALAKRTRIIHSPNITLGINFLLIAAKALKSIDPNTDIEIIEEHFKNKPEISGTARIIAKHLEINDESIKSVRAGGIIGTHEILFGSSFQTIRLKHESISREAFGNGVLFALNNLPRYRTGIYTIEDLLIPYFQTQFSTQSRPAPQSKPWWKVW